MGITEMLRRIWPFSANKIKKNSESYSKQPTQLFTVAHNCQKYVTKLISTACLNLPQTLVVVGPLFGFWPNRTKNEYL